MQSRGLTSRRATTATTGKAHDLLVLSTLLQSALTVANKSLPVIAIFCLNCLETIDALHTRAEVAHNKEVRNIHISSVCRSIHHCSRGQTGRKSRKQVYTVLAVKWYYRQHVSDGNSAQNCNTLQTTHNGLSESGVLSMTA